MKILITGASRGIGNALARTLAVSGPHRLLVLGRSEKLLAALDEEINTTVGPGRLDFLVHDLQNPDLSAVEQAVERMGGLNVLINNAGLLIKKDFEQLTEEEWRQSFDINFFAVVRLIKACLPFFPAVQKSHILNIGSMGGFQGSVKFPGLSAYSAAKAALANLTESLAVEFAERNIAVNCLSLGAVQTEMFSRAFPGSAAPLTSGSAAEWIAWFATHGHEYFNGKVLPVSQTTP